MATNKRDLRAYVRYDGTGRIIPGSLVLRRNKPKVGNWKEIQTYECCDGGGCCSDGTVQLIVSLPSGPEGPTLPAGEICSTQLNIGCPAPNGGDNILTYTSGVITPGVTLTTYTELLDWLNTNFNYLGFTWLLTGPSTIEVIIDKKYLTCNCQNPTIVLFSFGECPA